MARKPASNATTVKVPIEMTMSREDAKMRLVARIEKGKDLLQVQIVSADTLKSAKYDYEKWNAFNAELLKQIFTTEELSSEYSWWVGCLGTGFESLGQLIAEHHETVTDKLRRLDSIVERLELFPISSSVSEEQAAKHGHAESITRSRKVFVVHGQDELAKTSLEVFLHEIGLEPIVLHRQADEGFTVIEKFEKHSDVGYAFILLTPDEVAYLRSDEALLDDKRKKEFRARPNVIFEFGYFVGKPSRSRVCCIYTGDVTLPSDVHGMIYKRFNKSIDEVAYGIMKDLKASGYDIA